MILHILVLQTVIKLQKKVKELVGIPPNMLHYILDMGFLPLPMEEEEQVIIMLEEEVDPMLALALTLVKEFRIQPTIQFGI
jgi:hypothetical protein